MADYYTHFSFEVPVDDPETIMSMLAPLIDVEALEDGVPDGHPIFDSTDEIWSVPRIEAQGTVLWFSDDSDGDIDALVPIVQWVLANAHGAPESVTFEWALSCSKPRVDAYGGGAVKITKDRWAGVYSGSAEVEKMLDDKLADDLTVWRLTQQDLTIKAAEWGYATPITGEQFERIADCLDNSTVNECVEGAFSQVLDSIPDEEG